ncbi:hypothetical protein C2U71_29795 [Burkholderia ubonensis]|nr:hypothetical protein C2U71_29795 [Burkholderia ubonensis]
MAFAQGRLCVAVSSRRRVRDARRRRLKRLRAGRAAARIGMLRARPTRDGQPASPGASMSMPSSVAMR